MVKEKRSSVPNALVRSSTSFISQEPSFDVNTFLKKTLSNFSVDKGNHHQSAVLRTTDEESSSNDDKRNGRRSSSASDGGGGHWNKNQTLKPISNISSSTTTTTARKSCAYCGRPFSNGEYSSDLYCIECYHYFTQKSRTHIKSRIADMSSNDNAAPVETSNLLKTPHKKGDQSTRLSPKAKNLTPSPRRDSSAPRRQRRSGSPDGHRARSDAQVQSDVRIHDRPKQSSKSPLEKSIRRSSPAASRRNSWSSSSSSYPTCRICHLPGELGESLINPCRCSGTVQYVHTTCLVHWLEISSKKVYPSPQCELCGYHFRTHHCYRFRRLHYPQCDHRDKVLHMVFFLMAFIMIGCAVLSAVYLRADKGQRLRSSLNPEDIIVIACSVLFFCAFFVAVFTQYRADASVCRLILRCWLINKHWRVKDYDRSLDFERVGKSPRNCDVV